MVGGTHARFTTKLIDSVAKGRKLTANQIREIELQTIGQTLDQVRADPDRLRHVFEHAHPASQMYVFNEYVKDLKKGINT